MCRSSDWLSDHKPGWKLLVNASPAGISPYTNSASPGFSCLHKPVRTTCRPSSSQEFHYQHLCLYAQALLIFCSDCILGHTIA